MKLIMKSKFAFKTVEKIVVLVKQKKDGNYIDQECMYQFGNLCCDSCSSFEVAQNGKKMTLYRHCADTVYDISEIINVKKQKNLGEIIN